MRANFRSKIQFNKQSSLRLIVIFLISQILFCASAKQYIANRGNDLRDIPVLGLEGNVYGFNTVILFPIFGVAYNKNGKGVGIRLSHIGKYKVGDPDNKVLMYDSGETYGYFGNTLLMANSFHEPINADTRRVENKFYRVFTGNRCRRILVVRYRDDVQRCHYYENIEFYPVELSLGFILGVRIGFSAGELVDFLGGFAGFDPMDDDTSYTEPTYIDLPQPLTEKDWESKLDALDEKMNKRLTK
jgi:hypothetical protein